MEGMTMSPRLHGVALNVCRKGDAHKRHRKVIQPAFGISETKALHPVFQEIAVQVRRALVSLLHEFFLT